MYNLVWSAQKPVLPPPQKRWHLGISTAESNRSARRPGKKCISGSFPGNATTEATWCRILKEAGQNSSLWLCILPLSMRRSEVRKIWSLPTVAPSWKSNHVNHGTCASTLRPRYHGSCGGRRPSLREKFDRKFDAKVKLRHGLNSGEAFLMMHICRWLQLEQMVPGSCPVSVDRSRYGLRIKTPLALWNSFRVVNGMATNHLLSKWSNLHELCASVETHSAVLRLGSQRLYPSTGSTVIDHLSTV